MYLAAYSSNELKPGGELQMLYSVCERLRRTGCGRPGGFNDAIPTTTMSVCLDCTTVVNVKKLMEMSSAHLGQREPSWA